jgi:hypothetical protein
MGRAENYMNDAPVDVGIVNNPANTVHQLKVGWPSGNRNCCLPDHNRTQLSNAIGYSSCHISNTEISSGTAYKDGQYAIVNLAATPFKNFLAVIELEYGSRANFDGSYKANDVKLQFSFKYNFSQIFYVNKG